MMGIKDLLWQHDSPHTFLSYDQYMSALEGTDVIGHEVDGELVGAVVIKGPELHFMTFGQKWALTKTDIRRYLQPVIDQHGYVMTRVPKEDTRQQRFNKRLGFVPAGEDEFYVHMKLERLRA